MIKINEVAPRDGFQSIQEWIPTETKLEVIRALLASGIEKMEITSFVHPKAIPQMRDAEEIVETVQSTCPPNKEYCVLVPNMYGAKKALQYGIKNISYVCSATDSHNMENTKRTVAQSMDAFREIASIKGTSKLLFGQVCSLVCPFEGAVPYSRAIHQLGLALEYGADTVAICDTTGTATPSMVKGFLREFNAAFPGIAPQVHFHDTYGMGIANYLVALEMGVEVFDAAAAGIGGCPFTPGAMGNVATEDFVGMLHDMGVKTNIDLNKLLDAAMLIRQKVNGCSSSHRALVAEKTIE